MYVVPFYGPFSHFHHLTGNENIAKFTVKYTMLFEIAFLCEMVLIETFLP